MKKTTLLLIILSAVCANAEWKFDNDTDVQEKGDKRDEEREEARKALEGVRFGVKVEGGAGGSIIGESHSPLEIEGGIMLNFPLSRLNNGNLVLATELNYGGRMINNDFSTHQENYISIPLMFQYVSFFYSTSDIQVHWVKSPKRHVFMHLKTIAEAGVFTDIPFRIKVYNRYGDNDNYKDRNFLDLGVMVGGALQLESIILGARVATSYTDFGGGSTLLIQLKMYLGYLF
jgi:hypothetical protein